MIKKKKCKIDKTCFTDFFISNHIFINHYYRLLLHKTLVETKRHITILIMIQKWKAIMN